jgi:hypothetical protein
MKYTITVLQDDIDNGKPRSGRDCAIALAAKRELFTDNLWVSAVGIATPAERGELPSEARAFIPQFDQKLPVEPFKFEIDMEPRPLAYRSSKYEYGNFQQALADTSFGPSWADFDTLKYEPFTFDAFDALKDTYAKHTEPFQPKYTEHASNAYVKEHALLGEWTV